MSVCLSVYRLPEQGLFSRQSTSMMDGKIVTVEFTDDGFAIVRMRNGENRLNLNFLQSLNTALDEVERNESCKALISTGEGKFYSNGIDLDWLMNQNEETLVKFNKELENTMWRVMHFPLPTVAAINGHVFGGGAFLAMSHGYRVMRSDRGWISWNETHLKIRFGDMLLNLLSAKVVHMQSVREAVLFGKRVTAGKAKELFLVDAMTELPDILPKAKELALRALGRNGIDRDMLTIMKQDLYVRASQKTSKL